MTNHSKLLLIAGPCAIEGDDMAVEIATTVKSICEGLDIDFVFKGSYRKANRSRLDSFTGIGDKRALEILKKISTDLNVSVTTDIHESKDAEWVANFADILQIPAFLCRQTDLLVAAAKTGKVVNIKKGQFMSPEAMQFAAEKVKQTNPNAKVYLTERGSFFGYQDLVVDMRSIVKMKPFCNKVIMDCTHANQQPNQTLGVTGGDPTMIETMAKAAIAVGADGLFIETHPDPSAAKSDGANMLSLDQLEPLLKKIKRLHQAR